MIGYVAGSGWPEIEGVITVKRTHVYEGTNGADHIKELHRKGVDKLILTAAVGAVNSSYKVGTVHRLRDLITLFCPSPLEGADFVDMSQPLFHGGGWVTHAFVKGPHYETAADKQVLDKLGADVVGMSITPEVIMARKLGMEVIALCLVTNDAFAKHDHKEVLAVAEREHNNLKFAIVRAIEEFNAR